MSIHPTAIIDRRAELDATVEIGPYVIIDGPVRIGPGSRVQAGAFLSGWTEIGARVEIHPHAVIGHLPQDFHFGGERSFTRIGDGTIIREGATIHRGTQPESTTEVGPNCFLLAYSHVGHNCVVGEGVKLYNNALLAGHVEVAPFAIISGNSVVHQFCRIGEYVMIGGLSAVVQDLPPYFSFARGHGVFGINLIGLRRSKQFTAEEVAEVRTAHRILYRRGLSFSRAVAELSTVVSTPAGRRILEFVKGPSKRGIERGPRRRSTEADAAVDA